MSRKGFTLIELLIVVAIISILAGIVLVGLRPSLNTARDARRIAEIKQIQTGLQLYYNRFGTYPSALTDVVNEGIVTAMPTYGPGGPSDEYGYTANPFGTGGYLLGANLENEPSQATQNQVTQGTAGTVQCSDANAYCVSF